MKSRFKTWYENLIHLPFVHQTHNYDCGAAALRAVAHYYGAGPDDEGDFIKICNTSKKHGTDPTDIEAAAKKIGLRVRRIEGMSVDRLKGFLDDGKPVICAIQAYGEDEEDYDELKSGHYVVAIGYDEKYIFFEDPSVKSKPSRGHIPVDEFVERWVDVDRKKRVYDQLGIVVWKDAAPEEKDFIQRSKKIE